MSREKVFNFSAGPSVMPEQALREAAAQLTDYKGLGLSVMEMSHRSPMFEEILSDARERLTRLMAVPDSHEILFLQGGATLQFASIPMNLMDGGSADYALTGNFSAKAAKEAQKYGRVNIACSSKDSGYDRIPAQQELKLSGDARYFYYCSNNTVYGTQWKYLPQTEAPLVCDMSSDILSQPVDVSKYGLIYAGAQKNMAPAGLTVVIINKALAGRQLPITPEIMCYDRLIETGSLLNTPPCWCIYMLSLVLEWLEKQGGLSGMEQLKKQRAGTLYDFIDNSRLYTACAKPGSRSDMNISFRTGSDALDGEFAAEAAKRGLLNLKGHKVAGGLRASLYNAMPIEGVNALIDFMKEFEAGHNV